MEEKMIAPSMLTIKGIEAKLEPLIRELETEVEGLQIAFAVAVPDIEDANSLACTAYINMDLELLLTAIRHKMKDPLDKPLGIQ